MLNAEEKKSQETYTIILTSKKNTNAQNVIEDSLKKKSISTIKDNGGNINATKKNRQKKS